MRDFLDGLFVWVRGWGYILRHPSLLALASVPFVISLVALAFALTLIWSASDLVFIWFSQALISWGERGTWLFYLRMGLIYFAKFLASLIIIYFVYIAHTIVAQPFYSLMAERTRRLRGDLSASALGWWRMLLASLAKGFIFAVAGVVLFAASFVPGLNIAVVTGTLLLIAFDCMDYSLEARGLNLRQRFAYAIRNPAQWLGIAAGLALTLVVPGLTLLVIPGAVVGAALILKEAHESRTPSPKNPG